MGAQGGVRVLEERNQQGSGSHRDAGAVQIDWRQVSFTRRKFTRKHLRAPGDAISRNWCTAVCSFIAQLREPWNAEARFWTDAVHVGISQLTSNALLLQLFCFAMFIGVPNSLRVCIKLSYRSVQAVERAIQ